MASSTAQNLKAIVEAVRQHDSNCKEKGKAVALSPYEHERLGFDSVPVDGRTVPIIVDDSLGTGRFRVLCDGYHGPKNEEEVEDTVEDHPSPGERELVPAGMPDEEFHRIDRETWDKLVGEHPNCRMPWAPEGPCDPAKDLEEFARKTMESSGVRPSFLTPMEEQEFYRRVAVSGGRRCGRTASQERFRAWVGEWHPEIAIEEIRPGVVTYKLP